eukprot:5268624-Prymnesium_polylepis.1
MAATPDAFRGGLPGTLRPEHPPANPEDGLAQSARVRSSPDIHAVHQHMHANARRLHRAAADEPNRSAPLA